MDISEQQEIVQKNEADRMRERGVFWNPKTMDKLKQYAAWLKKQAAQTKKTLLLDGVTHSRARKDQLRELRKAYIEEYKRIKDKIEDGGR